MKRKMSFSLFDVLLVVVTATSCSIPGDGSVKQIDPDQIPYELNATTTSPPPTTVSATTTTTPVVETTTSTISSTIPVEIVRLFFVAGAQIVPIDRLLLSPAAAPQVLAALSEGPPEGDAAAGGSTTSSGAGTTSKWADVVGSQVKRSQGNQIKTQPWASGITKGPGNQSK